jgi:hypothetical protein
MLIYFDAYTGYANLRFFDAYLWNTTHSYSDAYIRNTIINYSDAYLGKTVHSYSDAYTSNSFPNPLDNRVFLSYQSYALWDDTLGFKGCRGKQLYHNLMYRRTVFL